MISDSGRMLRSFSASNKDSHIASAAVPETSFSWAILDYLSLIPAGPTKDSSDKGTTFSLAELICGGLIEISFCLHYLCQGG